MRAPRMKRHGGFARSSSPFIFKGLESLSTEFFRSDYPAQSKNHRDGGNETEISSLVSEADWRLEESDSDDDVAFQRKKRKSVSLEKKWEELHAKYETRDKIFAKATEGKNEAFVRLLREREEAVRELEKDLLALSDPCNNKRKKGRRRSSARSKYSKRFWSSKECEEHRKSEESKAKAKKGRQLYKAFVFELLAFVPAVLCLIVHTLAHIGYSEGVFSFITVIQKKIIPNAMSNMNRLYEVIMFVLGSWLMWLSGDLVYFLNDRDFDCVKLDYHNQARLVTWRAKWLKWVRHRNWIRTHFCICGWNIVYSIVEEWYGLVLPWIIDQKKLFLDGLPSRLCDRDVCLNDDLFPTPFLCSAEIERRQEEEWEIWEQKIQYTNKHMSIWSELMYWGESMQRLDELPLSPLYGPWTEVLVSVVVASLAIYGLRWYGYDIFIKE